MPNKAQWTAIIIGAILGAFLLVALGGLAGWAFSRPFGTGWGWPWHMGGWTGPQGSGSCPAVGGITAPGGMMGRWFGSGGMMGLGGGSCGFGSGPAGTIQGTLTMAEAGEAVESYLTSVNLSDLAVAEVMEFSNHFYVEVEEESTGVHAMELLVDKTTGRVSPEHGPNMMWNTKYGMHSGSGWGGMMGGFGSQQPSAEMSVSPAQALEYAQSYLDSYVPGKQAADEADRFYGYYTIHVLSDGQIYGMLSVNGYTGQVWYHNWHGQFVDMIAVEES